MTKAIFLAGLAALLAAAPAGAQAPGEGLYCENLEGLDAAREASNKGFDRLYAAISTMTTASFCGDHALAEKVNARIRAAIYRYDDRTTPLSEQENLQLRQLKASYVLGRQMMERSN